MKTRAARRRREPVDGDLWGEARIVATLMVKPGQLKPSLRHFMEKDGFNIMRLERISEVWQLRMSMPEHSQRVGSNTNGEPLTFKHFESALSSGNSAEMVRRAARESLSVREIRELCKEERKRRDEKDPKLLAENEQRQRRMRMNQIRDDITRQNNDRD